MTYTKQTWADGPSGNTPITAAALNHIEQGIMDAASGTGGVQIGGDLGGTLASPTVVGGTHHTHTSSQVTDLSTTVDNQVAVASLNNAFGIDHGVLVKPWAPSPTLLPELWQLSNFWTGGNTTTLSPSLTGNGTTQQVDTVVLLGNMSNSDTTFRLEFDYDLSAATNGVAVAASLVQTGGTIWPGTQVQQLVSADNNRKSGHYIIDFKPIGLNADTWLRVLLTMGNWVTGTVGISNVTLKTTGDVSRPMFVTQQGSAPQVWWQQYNLSRKQWQMGWQEWLDEGDLTPISYKNCYGLDNDRPFYHNPPDPTFLTDGSAASDIADIKSTAVFLHVQNNDQIMNVWNGSAYELRGNTHGGEFTRGAGATFKVDRGNGFVSWTLSSGLDPCRRFQLVLPTEFRLSTGGGVAYANVDRTHTLFPDGMIRVDRTTTFLSDTQFGGLFEWMTSHDTQTPMLGRIGRGTTILGDIDIFPKLAVPAAPTVTTSGTGGTLAAATYSYRVTAMSDMGETLPSAATTVTSTGTTSTNTVSWSAVSGATGYRVYGRSAYTVGVGEKLMATLDSATLSWVDDGSGVPQGDAPVRNTARLYNNTLGLEAAHSTQARWSVYYEPRTGWAFGKIYDSESVLNRPHVTQVRSRIESAPGIVKQYTNVAFDQNDIVIPSGTVWSVTHWDYAYIPQDPDQYHHEIMIRAASIQSLNNAYPNT